MAKPKIGKIKKFLVSNKSLLVLIFVTCISLGTYFGCFESNVKRKTYEIGNINERLFANGSNDYVIFVEYSSKGAFIAGRKINVDIELRVANAKISKFKGKRVRIVFPGAEFFNEKDRSPLGIEDASIELKFTENMDGHKATGNIKLKYMSTGLFDEPVIIPFDTNGKFTYAVLIDEKPLHISSFVRRNKFIEIASLETQLQLKLTNLGIILSYYALYISLVSFLNKF